VLRVTGPQVGVLMPDWPVPPRVRAVFTLRAGGVSQGPWAALNLGAHVSDDPAAVAENRRRVRERLGLPAEPYWLSQVHGVAVARVDEISAAGGPASDAVRARHPGVAASAAAPSPVVADAAITRQAGRVLAIQVADCLPVLFAARDGSVVAGAHAGWRGLVAGVLEATVAAMAAEGVAARDLMAWMGPAIGPDRFEVGDEVRDAFVRGLPGAGGPGAAGDPGATAAFTASRPGHWLCDLRQLAVRRLAAVGVHAVRGADRGREWCTHTNQERFFSHRRDGQCGRMAALVWID